MRSRELTLMLAVSSALLKLWLQYRTGTLTDKVARV